MWRAGACKDGRSHAEPHDSERSGRTRGLPATSQEIPGGPVPWDTTTGSPREVTPISEENRNNDTPLPKGREPEVGTGNGHAPGNAPARDRSPTRKVQRVTALRGLAANPPQKSWRSRLKTAEHELLHDSGIPYETFEKALRTLVCAFIARQDRASEGLLLRMSDLEYRVDDLESGTCDDT